MFNEVVLCEYVETNFCCPTYIKEIWTVLNIIR